MKKLISIRSKAMQVGIATLTATLLGVGLLNAGTDSALAQGNDGSEASGTVTIDGESSEEATSDESGQNSLLDSPIKTKRPKMSDRDPFQNPFDGSAPVNTAPVMTSQPDEPEVQDAPAPVVEAEEEIEEEIVETEPVEAPDLLVTGLINASGARHAILTSGEQSHMVHVGTCIPIGEIDPGLKGSKDISHYHVTGITDEAVYINYEGETFKLLIPDPLRGYGHKFHCGGHYHGK